MVLVQYKSQGQGQDQGQGQGHAQFDCDLLVMETDKTDITIAIK